MTTPSAIRAVAKMRTEPLDERGTKSRQVPGWSCPCGASQGRTVIATMEDAQHAADMHTRQAHPATVLGDLEAAITAAGLNPLVGVKFLGDRITYEQSSEGGRYIETAAGARYLVAPDGLARVYADAPGRPPVAPVAVPAEPPSGAPAV